MSPKESFKSRGDFEWVTPWSKHTPSLLYRREGFLWSGRRVVLTAVVVHDSTHTRMTEAKKSSHVFIQ